MPPPDSAPLPWYEAQQREPLAARQPPHNFQLEQALLGAVLVNNDAYWRVAEFLKPEHFADPLHGRIFGTAARMIERDQVVDYKMLGAFFVNDETLVENKRPRYVAELAEAAISIIDAGDYGHQIYDLFLRRELIREGERTVNDAYDLDVEVPASSLIESAETRLYAIAENGTADDTVSTMAQATDSLIHQMEEAGKHDGAVGITTGLRGVDDLIGGLLPGDFMIIAGRPSMGKTALGQTIVERNVERGKSVKFETLEMSKEQLAMRTVAKLTRIPTKKLRSGKLSRDEWAAVFEARRRVALWRLRIDDRYGTVARMRTAARRQKRKHGLDLLVIDYLQLMTGETTGGRDFNRTQEISSITRGLKLLAKALGIPVIALSQLSRAVEQREDKRPQLADLRESGSIEQDADIVMFVYRDEYYLEREPPKRKPNEDPDKFADRESDWRNRLEAAKGKADLLIQKNRFGDTGSAQVQFDGLTGDYVDVPRPGDQGSLDIDQIPEAG